MESTKTDRFVPPWRTTPQDVDENHLLLTANDIKSAVCDEGHDVDGVSVDVFL